MIIAGEVPKTFCKKKISYLMQYKKLKKLSISNKNCKFCITLITLCEFEHHEHGKSLAV